MCKAVESAVSMALKSATTTKPSHSLNLTSLPETQVVAVGCSAGGLDALKKFFSQVPVDSGLAFVVIQHLAPDRASALPEILQRSTNMRVVEVSDGQNISPNSVIVNSPGRDLSLRHGKFHLSDPVEPRGLRLPIDFFLCSLAADQENRAIGVVLSGMGSDGVCGLRAIKEKGGFTLAQDPLSASAESMPRSAINASVADRVAPPEALPSLILEYLSKLRPGERSQTLDEPLAERDFDKIIVILRKQSGTDFSLYKSSTLIGRMARRIALHQLEGLSAYVQYLGENSHEIDLLYKELLIGVTYFFRDIDVWTYLREEAIPSLLQSRRGSTTLRAWVPGCSTGEEAYSLAICFLEAQLALPLEEPIELRIYATDLDADAISKARTGFYPRSIRAQVPPEQIQRYFVEETAGYRLKKEVREMVIFAKHNIITDAPFTKLDILCCRNLLIYFRAELQKKLIPLFHFALNRDGLLLLGKADSVGLFADLFTPLENKNILFRRLERQFQGPSVDFPSRTRWVGRSEGESVTFMPAENIGRLTDQMIQQNFSPAAVLVNGDGDILYSSGRTGRYLEPAAGKVNVNLYALSRPGLREAIIGVVQRALQELVPIRLNGLQVDTNGGIQIVDVLVQAIDTPGSLRGKVLVVFKDIAVTEIKSRSRAAKGPEQLNVLTLDLREARESLRSMHVEMQSSLEELQSSNEELQSTNEELTSSKEEMQSLNEELQTVNAELQSKVEDLTGLKNDLSNLLNITEIAVVFLDAKLELRRYSAHATDLFRLIPSDIGRPLSDVVTDLDYPFLGENAKEVLRTLKFQEMQVDTYDGRWYRVRVMPYRTQDHRISGVVITFTNISEVKKLQNELEKCSKN